MSAVVTPPAPDDRLLTIPQVALRLSISTRKTWRLIAQRALPVLRVGERGTRILAADLDTYILKLRNPPAR